MKIVLLLFTLIFTLLSCNGQDSKQKKEKIIYKLHKKTGSQDTDTLWVSQNDSTVFWAEEVVQRYPDRNAELVIHYTLKKPKDSTYYYIHNPKGKLVQEGLYTAHFFYKGKMQDGNFYNSKQYSYKKSGKLKAIYYQEDGRNLKIEIYADNGKISEIIYFNKASSDKEKVEIYKNGKLKETRIYTAFDVYHTIKPDN